MPVRRDGWQEYVAGFVFDDAGDVLALVRKDRPAWQAGLLNGIGGKVEPGEDPQDAIRREVAEEAGVDVAGFEHFATVRGPWGAVHFYRAFVDAAVLSRLRTMESEPIELHLVDQLPYDQAIANLSWLVPLARYRHDRYAVVDVAEVPARR